MNISYDNFNRKKKPKNNKESNNRPRLRNLKSFQSSTKEKSRFLFKNRKNFMKKCKSQKIKKNLTSLKISNNNEGPQITNN